jgi:hypothetical protein
MRFDSAPRLNMTDSEHEYLEERAAIREYHGGQSRAEAEAGAQADLERMRRWPKHGDQIGMTWQGRKRKATIR